MAVLKICLTALLAAFYVQALPTPVNDAFDTPAEKRGEDWFGAAVRMGLISQTQSDIATSKMTEDYTIGSINPLLSMNALLDRAVKTKIIEEHTGIKLLAESVLSQLHQKVPEMAPSAIKEVLQDAVSKGIINTETQSKIVKIM